MRLTLVNRAHVMAASVLAGSVMEETTATAACSPLPIVVLP